MIHVSCGLLNAGSFNDGDESNQDAQRRIYYRYVIQKVNIQFIFAYISERFICYAFNIRA